MKLTNFFKHRIGYAARVALLGGLLGVSISAQAAINYLVISFPDGATYAANRIRISVAATCPPTYYFHLYGANDVQGWYFICSTCGPATDWSTYGVAGLIPGICVAGVPASVAATLIYADAGSTTPVSPNSIITISGASIDLNGYTTAVGGGLWTPTNGTLLMLPDSFTVAIGGGSSGADLTSYVSYGIIGAQMTGSSSSFGVSPRQLLNLPVPGGVYRWAPINFVTGGNSSSGNAYGGVGKKHFYAIGY